MSTDWSKQEVEAIVADYRAMLYAEIAGEKFSKAEHERRLSRVLDGRTHGSISRKYQNISAIMLDLGYPYIDGYKRLGNYQQMLRDVVSDQMSADTPLQISMKRAAESFSEPPVEATSGGDILDMIEDPPYSAPSLPYLQRVHYRHSAPPKLNYLELEATNAAQGKAGEVRVLKFERARLIKAGRESLADRIEWISTTVGDHAGFDIRSFETSGADRLIEVKTTKGGKETPFFVTRNEVRVSVRQEKSYHLYRLFRFQKGPKLFTVAGALDQTCVLDPTAYEARVG